MGKTRTYGKSGGKKGLPNDSKNRGAATAKASFKVYGYSKKAWEQFFASPEGKARLVAMNHLYKAYADRSKAIFDGKDPSLYLTQRQIYKNWAQSGGQKSPSILKAEI